MGEKFIQFEKLPEFWAGNWQGEREPYSVDSSNPRRTGSTNNWQAWGRKIGRPVAENWQAWGGKLTNNLNLEGREKLTNIIFQIWKGGNFGESRRENLLIFTNFGQTLLARFLERSPKSSSAG